MANNDYKLSGTILVIDKTRPAKEGSSMMLRDFILQQSMMGEINDIKCSLKGNNCSIMDSFMPGDEVVVNFALIGSFGGAVPKEGHARCETNPTGITSFSPNVTVFKCVFEDGFRRAANVQPVQAAQAINSQTQQSAPPPQSEDDLPF